MFADDTTIPLPALYVSDDDPAVTYTDGRVKAQRLWLDTSTGTIGTLKKRNAANANWDTLIDFDVAAASLTTEQVQDIIGAILTDSSTVDFVYDDGAGTVIANVKAQARSVLLDMQRWTINFTADGDAYIPADVAMTIDVGVAAIGTGTLAYEKSTTAAPSTFSSTSLPATLQAGAWLKVSVSSVSGFKVVELKRTA